MSQIEEILNGQIATADQLFQRAKCIPDGEPSMHLPGFIRYNEIYTRPLSRDTDAWEAETLEFLRALYGENSRQQAEFQKCTREKHHYMKFREELQDELKRCTAYLQALIKVHQMNEDMPTQDRINDSAKSPLVFISHSSKDKEFAEALVVLLEDLGMDSSSVFCSSVDGYGIGLSQDIFDTLRSLFKEHELFVIFIHSPRYYLSTVSLNEMGAAWVLKTDFCSILTSDMNFRDMTGVINDKSISIKVDTNEAASRLTQLKDKLLSVFGLKDMDNTKWERKRNAFLRTVNSIKYTVENENLTKSDTHAAVIRCYSEKEKSGQRQLYIKNEGNGKARNLYVDIPNQDEYYASHPNLPYTYDELLPGAYRVITLALIEGQHEATVHFAWDDDSCDNNVEHQTIDY